MKSLIVAPTLPSESGNGLAMRIGAFAEALARVGEVELIVLPIFETSGSSNPLCQRLQIEPTIVPVKGRADTPFTLLSRIADPHSRLESFREYGKPSLSAFASVPVLADIRQKTTGRRYDLVHIARAYLLPVIDAWPKDERPVISVDLDEDDEKAHRQIAMLHRQRGNAEAGAWLEAEAVAFARLVERRLPDADLAFISTDLDRQSLRRRNPGSDLILAENAVAIPNAPPVRKRPGSELLFVGGFGYFPNLDAASWILETIFPQLTEMSVGSASLTIVGRNPPRALCERARSLGVTILEDVEDLAPIYERANIAMVPMRGGGGSRIKLLEAASYGVPIVATTIGAEGTHMRDGEELWIADTPQTIVEAIKDVFQMPTEAGRRANAARTHVETFHARPALISKLARRFARTVGDHRAPATEL